MSDILIRLFGYESSYKDLIERPWLTSYAHGQATKDFEQEYLSWQETKRKFSPDEVPGCYVLVGNNGQSFIRWLHGEGSLTEKPLFDQSKEWGGSWKVNEDGALIMNVDVCSIFVLASKNGNMHGAIQTSQNSTPVYFKVISVQQE